MAGVNVGDETDNPIAINVTPLVDIIFCLCVFFMISFKFKQLEGRFDTWLPRNVGLGNDPPGGHVLPEVRVALSWDETTQRVVRTFGSRRVDDDEELGRVLQEAHDDCVRLTRPDTPVTIDAEARVPWNEVVDVMNLSKKSGLEHIEFAFLAPPAGQR